MDAVFATYGDLGVCLSLKTSEADKHGVKTFADVTFVR